MIYDTNLVEDTLLNLRNFTIYYLGFVSITRRFYAPLILVSTKKRNHPFLSVVKSKSILSRKISSFSPFSTRVVNHTKQHITVGYAENQNN